MYKLQKYLAYGAVIGATILAASCNTFMRTCEGIGRVGRGFYECGERIGTGIIEDWNSVTQNYQKEPYALTAQQKLEEKTAEKEEKESELEKKTE